MYINAVCRFPKDKKTVFPVLLFSLTVEECADLYLFCNAIDLYGSASWASGVNSEEEPLELGDDAVESSFLRNAAIFGVAVGLVAVYVRARKTSNEHSKHG